jgi:hypothetical protein
VDRLLAQPQQPAQVQLLQLLWMLDVEAAVGNDEDTVSGPAFDLLINCFPCRL